MTKKYDVFIIGAGVAGLYTSIIIKKGTPMQVPSEPITVGVAEANRIGGLTKYAFIQITKKWAFSGSNLIRTLYGEAVQAGVDFFENSNVTKIVRQDNNFKIITNDEIYVAKYVIVATGILTFPNILDTPEKTNIGLHTPEEMVKEITKEFGWKKVLVVGNESTSINNLATRINNSNQFDKVDSYLINKNVNINSDYFGLDENLTSNYDGILFDYNSYKLNNGSTAFLNNLNILQENGYVEANAFGETRVPGLFAVGSVTMPISGVPEAIYSGQVTGLYVGHLLEKTTIADYSGRFPFLPREENWKYSFQHKLEKDK
ncbi:NAD(P)/FAD-dependent oxidoreductase [uncultured Lactobacillus sp.]|uniref:NAD(P)/FAD-dependent oxidoreductase n=1 Tax=uncultured Lactobacillus sp. TaxID=153152 RepID=UPI00259BC213|nr:NAD(P)/FAD-dependent oxidoreductase [uncultured Lactobacillus sp.]